MTDEQMRYPIGKFEAPLSYTQQDTINRIKTISELPGKLRQAVTGLNEQQLDTPYRTGGWTIRQVVHHVPDSHMNALVRLKWTLTEDNPTIKAYREADWALLPDYKLPIEPSLKMLEAIHARLVMLLESLTEDDLERTFYHPDSKTTMPIKRMIALYAWHGNHHLAHITETVKQF